MVFTSSIRKQGSKILYIYNKMRCTTVNSNVNSSESNNINKSNSDNIIGDSNLPSINDHTESSFNTLVNL